MPSSGCNLKSGGLTGYAQAGIDSGTCAHAPDMLTAAAAASATAMHFRRGAQTRTDSKGALAIAIPLCVGRTRRPWVDGALEECSRRRVIALGAKQEVGRAAVVVDRAVLPLAADFDVGLVHPPALADWALRRRHSAASPILIAHRWMVE